MEPMQQVQTGKPLAVVADVLNWARCHPGILLVGSVALAALVAKPVSPDERATARPPETEADFVDG